jgi:hypothetical protein
VVSTPALSIQDPLIYAMQRGDKLTLLSGKDDEALIGRGLFAVPVCQTASASGPDTSYFFIVESMPPDLINQRTLDRLLVVARTLRSTPLISTTAITTDTVEKVLVTQLVPVAAIPEVKSWRTARWLPSRLRPAEPTDTARLEGVAVPTSAVSR